MWGFRTSHIFWIASGSNMTWYECFQSGIYILLLLKSVKNCGGIFVFGQFRFRSSSENRKNDFLYHSIMESQCFRGHVLVYWIFVRVFLCSHRVTVDITLEFITLFLSFVKKSSSWDLFSGYVNFIRDLSIWERNFFSTKSVSLRCCKVWVQKMMSRKTK